MLKGSHFDQERPSAICSPRVVDAGDASVRDVQQVLEEQCMKHGVVRRGDHLPIMLVSTKQKSRLGIITLDMTKWKTFLQSRPRQLYIADGGFEAIFKWVWYWFWYGFSH